MSPLLLKSVSCRPAAAEQGDMALGLLVTEQLMAGSLGAASVGVLANVSSGAGDGSLLPLVKLLGWLAGWL